MHVRRKERCAHEDFHHDGLPAVGWRRGRNDGRVDQDRLRVLHAIHGLRAPAAGQPCAFGRGRVFHRLGRQAGHHEGRWRWRRRINAVVQAEQVPLALVQGYAREFLHHDEGLAWGVVIVVAEDDAACREELGIAGGVDRQLLGRDAVGGVGREEAVRHHVAG